MTTPGIGGAELAVDYISVVPSLAGIEKNMVEGGKKAATVFSESFRLETSKALTTASGSISQVFGTVLKPKMAAAGLEAGKSYGTSLGAGIKASQAEVAGSLAGINSAFSTHRQVIADTTKQVEGFGLAAVAVGGKVTGAVPRLGALGTGFKGLGTAAKEAGEHLKGLGASVLGVGESIAKTIASPLGLTGALAGSAAAAGLLTDRLVHLGDQWLEVDRTLMVSGGATSETIAGLDHIVQDVASHSAAAISGISGVVATLSAQTHGLSGAEMRDLTRDIADLGEIIGRPIDTRSLLEGAHALGVADDQLDAYVKQMFSVSRATGVPMEQIIEETHKMGASLKEMGIDSSVAVSLLAQLDEQGGDATKMMRAFSKVAADAKVEHKSFNQVLTEQVKRIEDINKAQGHQAAANYATSFFGPRGSIAIMGMMDSGALSSANLAQAIKGPTESIQELMEKTAGLGEAFRLAMNVASVALAPVAKILTRNIAGGIDGVAAYIRTHGAEIVGFFGKIADGAITAAEGIIRGFQPVLTMLGKLEYAFGDWTDNSQLMNSGQDLQDFASHMNQPGGVIDSLEQAKHKTDDWIKSMQAATGVGELLDDALELPEKGQPDTGLRIKEPTKDEPHAGDDARDDLKRLRDQYGVGVTQDGSKLNVTATIKTDLPKEEQAEVDKKLKKLTDDGVHYSLDHGKLSVSADTKKAKQDVVDLINSLAGKDLKIPVTIDPHSPGDGDHHDDHPDNPHRTSTEGTRGRKRPGLTTGGWEGGFAAGGFPGDFLPGYSATDNLLGTAPGQGWFGLAGGEGIVKSSAAQHPWVRAQIGKWNRGFAGGTDTNIFPPIPLPNLDPNAPAPPPGGWSTKTQQHDDAWAASIEAAKRSTEHASDRVEDLGTSIAEYSSTITDLKEKMIDDDPKDLIADQKELAKTERELARAQRDYLEAVTDENDAKKKEATTRAKPPESSSGGGKDSGAEGFGADLVKGLLKGMGFPDVFGASIFDWGVVKTGMAALGDILNLAKTKGWLGGHGIGAAGTGHGESFFMQGHGESFTIPMSQDAQTAFAQSPVFGGGTGGAGGTGQGTGPGTGQGGPSKGYWWAPGAQPGPGQGATQPPINLPPRPQGPIPVIPMSPGDVHPSGYSAGGDGSQVQLASAIYSRVVGAGYSPAVGTASVAAAMYESGLTNNQDTGRSGHWGLFQEQGNYPGAHGSTDDQISWLLQELQNQGGPAAFNAGNPANMIASRVERGGYSGSNYNLGAAAALLGGAASGGGGFPSGAVQSTGFSGGGFGGGFTPQPYGLPKGTDIRQGAGGFPPWVYALGAAYGLQPSTYAGHQEGSGQNRGIDWFPTNHADMSGASYSPDETARLQAFASALQGQMPGMDPAGQVIFSNRSTGQKTGVAHGSPVGPGTSDPGYYRDDWSGHQGHVHTSFSMSEPVPGGQINQMVPPGAQGAPGQYPTAPQAQPRQPGVTLTSQSIGGDLGLQGLDDGLHPPVFPDYTYQHGSVGPLSLVSMIPGSDKFMHPFRGQQNPLGPLSGNIAPPPAPAVTPASSVTTAMQTRTAPDLEHVGAGKGAGGVNLVSHYHFNGVTPNAVAQIQPKMTSVQISASRATVPRTH